MAYTFRCRAAAELLMLDASADAILRIIGKAPAVRGVITPEEMPGAIRAIEQAVEQAVEQAKAQAGREDANDDPQTEDGREQTVSLRQRTWPFLAMLRQAAAAREPITWGI